MDIIENTATGTKQIGGIHDVAVLNNGIVDPIPAFAGIGGQFDTSRTNLSSLQASVARTNIKGDLNVSLVTSGGSSYTPLLNTDTLNVNITNSVLGIQGITNGVFVSTQETTNPGTRELNLTCGFDFVPTRMKEYQFEAGFSSQGSSLF